MTGTIYLLPAVPVLTDAQVEEIKREGNAVLRRTPVRSSRHPHHEVWLASRAERVKARRGGKHVSKYKPARVRRSALAAALMR